MSTVHTKTAEKVKSEADCSERLLGAAVPVSDLASGGETYILPETQMPLIQGIVIGWVQDTSADGGLAIDYDGNPLQGPVWARLATPGGRLVCGQPVAVMFEKGDVHKPIVIGPIYQPDLATQPFEDEPIALEPADVTQPLDVKTDGQTVTLTAEKEIVLRCGKASLTLTRAGKVLIRGAYLLSRSSGVNRIKGGSVQIN